MKLYAQHGFQNGTKIEDGLTNGFIDGVIFSPRDIALDKLTASLEQLRSSYKNCDLFVDPQLYACFLARVSEARLGNLLDDYSDYFTVYRRSQLEREKEVRTALRAALEFQTRLPVSSIIAPNILIPASFNSVEAVIAKNFIRFATEEYSELKDKRPLYATLAVSREALLDKQELVDFLNEITILDEAPHGFYVLISARNIDAKSDIFHSDVIAGMMLMNYSLNLNGFKIINGYSDILTPFLGAVGAQAGCTGWWSNLRAFSLDRFAPTQGGGRTPIPRYLCNAMLNRITFYELNQLRQSIPDVLNGLESDDYYPEENGSEPKSKTAEILQSWDAIKTLSDKLIVKSTVQSLMNCQALIARAYEIYDEITIQLDRKSQSDHLDALAGGIEAFIDKAEIKLPDK